MKVKSIRFKGAGGAVQHESFLELPDTGICLIMGENGVGKSSAIAVLHEACWNKPLGKKPIWRIGKRAKAIIKLDSGLDIEATCTPSGTRAINIKGVGVTPGATPTKTREILSNYIPTSSLWQFSCYMSGSSLNAFSSASDTKRKEVITHLMQLGFFDKSLKAYKKVYEAAKDAAASANVELAGKKAVSETLNSQIEQLKSIPDVVDAQKLPKLREEAKQLQIEIAADTVTMNRFVTKERELAESIGIVKAQLRRAKDAYAALDRQRENIATKGTCPTCNQACNDTCAIDKQLLAQQLVVDAAAKEVDPNKDAELQDARKKSIEVRDSRNRNNIRFAAVQAEGKTLVIATKAVGGKSAQLDQLITESNKAAELFSAAKALVSHTREDLAVKEFVRKGLGPKGIQAVLIEDGLQAIENAANTFMGTLFPKNPDSQIRISINDNKLELDVIGLADDKGYDALSDGQKRRVDFAIMFAFGESARIAQEIGSTTLWIDESLAFLDRAGKEAACALINELAKRHCVVIITHLEDVHAALRPVVTYVVTEGGKYSKI